MKINILNNSSERNKEKLSKVTQTINEINFEILKK